MFTKDQINAALYDHPDNQAPKVFDDFDDKGTQIGGLGRGILCRDQSDIWQNYFNPLDDYNVLPAAWLHNSIKTPHPLYNLGVTFHKGPNPNKPIGNSAAVACINFSHLDNVFNTDDLANWGWHDGVFYPHDANSCDKRAIWLRDFNAWEGPCSWQELHKDPVKALDKIGSGRYSAGNPSLLCNNGKGFGGGGTGYHTNLNRADASKSPNANQNDSLYGKVNNVDFYDQKDCVCYFKMDHKNLNPNWMMKSGLDDWSPFIIEVNKAANNKFHGQCSMHDALDSLGWVNDIRAMISIQNAFWWLSDKFNGNPKSGGGMWYPRTYESAFQWEGWNEIPMDKQQMLDINNWDGLAVMLPIPKEADATKGITYDDLNETYEKALIRESCQKHNDIPSLKGIADKGIAIIQQTLTDELMFTRKCIEVRTLAEL